MDFRLSPLLLLFLLLPVGCATPPPPRESPEVAVIGASVKLAAPLWRRRAEFAYFVRLEDADSQIGAKPIRSNYTRDGYVFLFNARPGRYALVSAGYVVKSQGAGTTTGVGSGVSVGVSVSSQNTFNTYLPKTVIDNTVVTVESGEWVFMGDIVLDKTDWDEADEVQHHYYSVLAPGHKDKNFVLKLFSNVKHYAGVAKTLSQDKASLARFLESSHEIAGEEWANTLQSPVAAGPPDL